MDVCLVCNAREVSRADRPCIFCFFTGRYFEQVLLSEERSWLLERIRQVEQVERAEVWHQGHGAFSLCVALKDGRLVFPGVKVQIVTFSSDDGPDDGQAVMPAIPPVDGLWGIAVANEDDEDEPVVFMDGEFTDDGLVDAISQMASFNQMLDT